MKLKEALELERQRDEEGHRDVVYVHRDGKFYHIYEWSAWLIKAFVCTEEMQKQRGDGSVLRARRYSSKNGEYVMLGFPVESLSKYVPEYMSCTAQENGDLELTVATGDTEDMRQAFDEWREGCAPADRSRGNRDTIVDGRASVLARSGIFGIMAQMLSYPVEQKTPTENIEFISRMKQEIAALL